MKGNKKIPDHVVLEALGYFTLNGSDEQQVNIAEQIASMEWSSLDNLINTIQGYAPSRKFKKELAELKESDFFKPYWL